MKKVQKGTKSTKSTIGKKKTTKVHFFFKYKKYEQTKKQTGDSRNDSRQQTVEMSPKPKCHLE